MNNFWHQLNERERWMLSIAGACIFLYLLYMLIYSPLTTAISNKTLSLNEKKETLAWMQQIQQLKNNKNPHVISHAKLLTLIDTQLANSSLKSFPYQLQQTNLSDIQLTFDEVPFNPFLSWIWTLTNDYAITLKQLSAEKIDTPGMVKITILLSTK